MITRHKTDYWIPNNSTDVSMKDIFGKVAIHWHEFYEIEVILEGEGTYRIDGIDYEVKRGALFFMCPGSFHQIDFRQKTRLINFMFTLESCDSDFLVGLFQSSPHIFMHLSDRDIEMIHTLAKEAASANSVKYQNTVLNCVLGKIQQMYTGSAVPVQTDQMQYAVLYIQNHFKDNIKLEQAAEIAKYSPNYFGNKFKEYTGVTFREYVLNLRFSFAERMLEKTALSVSEICYACGFRDFSDFIRLFRKRNGVTPKQFRSQKQNTGKSL